VSGGVEAADAFAYVDNCLDAAERRAFEARLRDDPELGRQVALWEAQNSAIRAAFGGSASARAAIDLGRSSNENLPLWMASSTQTRRAATSRSGDTLGGEAPNGDPRAWPSRAEAAAASRGATPEPPAGFSMARGLLAVAVFACALLLVAPPGGPLWPRDKLTAAGLAAYSAFAAPGASAPLEFRTGDADVLTKWLMPQFARGVVAPQLRSSRFTLLGGRIAPGTTASAAFVVYDDRRGGRVGILIEPLDAPAPSEPELRGSEGLASAAWSDGGRGLVAVGANRDAVLELARLVDASR